MHTDAPATYVADTRAVFGHTVHIAREDLGLDGTDDDRLSRLADHLGAHTPTRASLAFNEEANSRRSRQVVYGLTDARNLRTRAPIAAQPTRSTRSQPIASAGPGSRADGRHWTTRAGRSAGRPTRSMAEDWRGKATRRMHYICSGAGSKMRPVYPECAVQGLTQESCVMVGEMGGRQPLWHAFFTKSETSPSLDLKGGFAVFELLDTRLGVRFIEPVPDPANSRLWRERYTTHIPIPA